MLFRSLVIVTANVGPGENQRVDVSILDSSENRNVHLSKKGIKGETRLAVTTHADGEVGVCFKNHIEGGMYSSSFLNRHTVCIYITIFVAVPHGEQGKLSRVVDLDIDIGADAVDYKYVVSFLGNSCHLNFFLSSSAIANQESLSALETEMRKLEGLVKEVVDEMGYLKTREQKFTDTNCAFHMSLGPHIFLTLLSVYPSFNGCSRSKLCMVLIAFSHRPWHMANLPPSSFLQTEIPYRLNNLFGPLEEE